MLYPRKVAGRCLSPTVFGWYTVLILPCWPALDITALLASFFCGFCRPAAGPCCPGYAVAADMLYGSAVAVLPVCSMAVLWRCCRYACRLNVTFCVNIRGKGILPVKYLKCCIFFALKLIQTTFLAGFDVGQPSDGNCWESLEANQVGICRIKSKSQWLQRCK